MFSSNPFKYPDQQESVQGLCAEAIVATNQEEEHGGEGAEEKDDFLV